MANPAQSTSNLKLAPKPVEGGDSNCTTIMHNNKMPPGGDNGVTNSGPLNEVPPDGYLLAGPINLILVALPSLGL